MRYSLAFALFLLSAAVVLVLSARSLAPDQPADQAERTRLTGLYKGFTVEGKGETPDKGPVQIELTVTDKTIKGVELKGKERIDHGEGEYTLDLAADPRGLDASQTNARGRKDGWVGIYSLEGDTLKWCVSKKTRPATFETVKGQFLLILKRHIASAP